MSASLTAAAVIIGAVILALDKFGLLERFGLVRRAAGDALAELDIAARTIERLRTERDQAVDKAEILARERSLEPILEAIHGVLETQQQTLTKLAHFNGALKRNEEGLREATEALKLIAGLVVGATGIPTPPPPRLDPQLAKGES